MGDTLSGFLVQCGRKLSASFGWPVPLWGKTPLGENHCVGVSEPTAATVTLTFAANATSGDLFHLGGQDYRVMTTPAQAYDIQLGGSAAITLDNIKSAVNTDGTAGAYFTGTKPNPAFTATTNTATTQLFVALVPGSDGNTLTATEAFTDAGNVFSSVGGGTNAALKVDATISATAESTAEATAATPSYTEGQDAPLSQDLTGNLRVVAKSGGYSASATFTPAATSHAAGDANGTAGTFTTMGPSAGIIMLTTATLEIDGGTAEATAWRLHLFNVTPPSALADDAAFTLPSGDRASYLGYVDLGTAADIGDTQWVETSGVNKQLKLSGTNLFGYLVNQTTLTPAAVAHIVTLHAVAV